MPTFMRICSLGPESYQISNVSPSVAQGENLFVLTSLMIVEIINEFIRVYLNNFAQNLYQNIFFYKK